MSDSSQDDVATPLVEARELVLAGVIRWLVTTQDGVTIVLSTEPQLEILHPLAYSRDGIPLGDGRILVSTSQLVVLNSPTELEATVEASLQRLRYVSRQVDCATEVRGSRTVELEMPDSLTPTLLDARVKHVNRYHLETAVRRRHIADARSLPSSPFQKLEGSRTSAFERLDKPAMQPLPAVRYALCERRNARVNIDYHVHYDGRYYSVPYPLVHERVEIRATAGVVEIFLIRTEGRRCNAAREHDFQAGDRVATHQRSYARQGTAVTDSAHRPANHQEQVWPPQRLVHWGQKFGPAVATVIEQMLARYVIPEQGYRACLGLLRTAERHGGQRMNAACERALAVNSNPTRKYIEAMLKRGLDQQPRAVPTARQAPLEHENVRGGDYYDRKENIH